MLLNRQVKRLMTNDVGRMTDDDVPGHGVRLNSIAVVVGRLSGVVCQVKIKGFLSRRRGEVKEFF